MTASFGLSPKTIFMRSGTSQIKINAFAFIYETTDGANHRRKIVTSAHITDINKPQWFGLIERIPIGPVIHPQDSGITDVPRRFASIAICKRQVTEPQSYNGIRLAERTTCGGMGARKDKRPQQLLQPLRPGNHAMETSRPSVHDVHHHLAPPFRPKLPRHGGSVNGRPRGKDKVRLREFAGRHSGLSQTLPRGGVTAMAPCTPQPDVVVIGHRGNQPHLKSFREVVDRFQRAMPLERVREITAPPDHPMPRFREGPTKQTVALRTAPFAGKIVEWVIDPNIHEWNPPRAQTLEEATPAKHPKRGVFSLRGRCVSPKRWTEARLTIPSPAHGQGQCHGRSSTVQDSRGYSEVRGSRGAPWPKR